MTSLPHLKSLRFCVPFESTTGPRGLGKGLATLPMQPQSISIRLSLGLGSQNAALRPTCWKTTLDPRGVDKGRPVCQHLPPIGEHFCTLPNFHLLLSPCVCQTKPVSAKQKFFGFLVFCNVDAQNRFKQILFLLRCITIWGAPPP